MHKSALSPKQVNFLPTLNTSDLIYSSCVVAAWPEDVQAEDVRETKVCMEKKHVS